MSIALTLEGAAHRVGCRLDQQRCAMKTLAYIALGLCTAAVTFAGAYLAHLGTRPGVRCSALDFEARDEAEYSADLERQRQILLSRLAARLDIAQAVVRRDLPLLEAASRLRDLISADAQARHWLRTFGAGRSEEELFCRQAIGVVGCELLDGPAGAAEVARLEAELQVLIDRDALHFQGPLSSLDAAAKGVNRANTSTGEIAPRLRLCSGAICIR
jgi:hypothetical protein